MEMRLILVHLIHHFHFKLAPPTSNYDRATYLGINRGTMGPQNLAAPGLPSLGLNVQVEARR